MIFHWSSDSIERKLWSYIIIVLFNAFIISDIHWQNKFDYLLFNSKLTISKLNKLQLWKAVRYKFLEGFWLLIVLLHMNSWKKDSIKQWPGIFSHFLFFRTVQLSQIWTSVHFYLVKLWSPDNFVSLFHFPECYPKLGNVRVW